MTTTYQTNITDQEYNGWTNYETWNVALWLQNDQCYYDIALLCDDYQDFVDALEVCAFNVKSTPDGVKWNDPKLNHHELNDLIEDL